MRLVMYADQENTNLSSESNKLRYRKKMIASVSGPSYVLTMNSLLYAIATYPFDIFLTFPRILREAYELHYNKKLGIYHRPIPIEGTVVKLEPNSIDLYVFFLLFSLS
jgi:hypothetical protein